VTEWCKKKVCWEKVVSLSFAPPPSLVPELGKAGSWGRESIGSEYSQLSPEERESVEAVSQVPPETWFEVSGWTKETANLQPWQHGIAYSLGRLVGQGRKPSAKQAKQGLKLLEQVRRLGDKLAASMGLLTISASTDYEK
jgi:hypothetical protein